MSWVFALEQHGAAADGVVLSALRRFVSVSVKAASGSLKVGCGCAVVRVIVNSISLDQESTVGTKCGAGLRVDPA